MLTEDNRHRTEKQKHNFPNTFKPEFFVVRDHGKSDAQRRLEACCCRRLKGHVRWPRIVHVFDFAAFSRNPCRHGSWKLLMTWSCWRNSRKSFRNVPVSVKFRLEVTLWDNEGTFAALLSLLYPLAPIQHYPNPVSI